MTTDPQIPEQSAHGDQNVERLLGHAYQPELPDADFVQRVEDRLLATAQQLAGIRSAVPADETLRLRQVRRRLAWVLGTAAALTIIALGWHAYRMWPAVQRVARVSKSLDPNYRYREEDGAGVTVTQGQLQVGGVDGMLRAWHQVRPGAASLTPAPRASYLLAWARELMPAAEAPLVPESKYADGALSATNQAGHESRLTLRRYHLDVHIEDGFARTTIDQTYFNEESWRTEGTFYFPLPPDASLSRLAMYVDGTLMEGGMAERDHARNVYEQILYTRRDPALLEWVDGSTFKMRVFPLEARQEKRIVLSYTQR